MERLTEVMTCPDGTKLYDISNKLAGLNVNRAVKTRMILEKLATYEDAEEQGLLIRLPCKADEKQMAKKIEIFNGQACCPNCKTLFGEIKTIRRLKTWSMSYCKYCGQKLNWTDVE